MSARSEPDLIDYIDDNTQREDESAFIPMRPDSFPDMWSAFYGGMLIGIAGGALATIAPWLAGALISTGYGMAAYALGGRANRVARALRFGFGIIALIGAAVFLGSIFFPHLTWSSIAYAARHHAIFLSVALLPWAIAVVKYIRLRFFSRTLKSASRG